MGAIYMKPLAVHFGAGALGRGLAIPFLTESGYDVVAVDADRQLIDRLRAAGGYQILLTDQNVARSVPIHAACLPDDDALMPLLAQAGLITTSVRKENLHYIASLLKGITPKTVICCENIEQSGEFFAGLMSAAGVEPTGWLLPDCMVDRICSARWPDALDIETESYGTICVQAIRDAEIPARFEKTDHIAARFQEKRLLVNTYADGVSLLGRAAGHHYLYEAAADNAINREIAGYMHIMKFYLHRVCRFEPRHLDDMAAKHRARLCNPAIKRPLATVARNFLVKMTPRERFIFPLAELLKRNENIDAAIPFLRKLIAAWLKDQPDPALAKKQVFAAIQCPDIVRKLEEAI
jgi:mannitol-1-phosphate 5-dehydrogenase